MIPCIVNYMTYPLAQFYAGRRSWRKEFWALCRLQWLSPDKLHEHRLKLLRSILEYVYKEIPYYRRVIKKCGMQADKVDTINDIQSLPFLDKNTINLNVDNLYNPRFSVKYYKNTTSGSTGHPVTFYDDGFKAGLGVAEENRIKNNYGLKIGLREARFVRLTEETISLNSIFKKRKMLINQMILPGMNLSEEIFERIKNKLFKFKPEIIYGISSALYEFTKYFKDKGVLSSPWKVKLVICWAAPVFDHYTDLLRNFYGCPVVNLYSTREVGHIASTCPEGKLHLHEENRLVEIVKDGKPVEEGKRGEIVVTTLRDYAMPMIRYKTGDIGRISKKRCRCGRGTTVLEELEGRLGDILYLTNGRIISPNYCCRIMMSPDIADAISQFKIVQTGGMSLEIRVVKSPKFRAQHERMILSNLENSLGRGTSLDLRFVTRIDPQPSGKYQISKCNLKSCESGLEPIRACS